MAEPIQEAITNTPASAVFLRLNHEDNMPELVKTPPLLIDTPAYSGPDRRTEMRAWRSDVDKRLNDGAQIMKHLRSELAENTIATKQVQSDTSELVSLLNSFKGAMRALDMLGKLARPLGYIAMAGSAFWGLFTVIKGGGQIK